jgi:hypothetical protein
MSRQSSRQLDQVTALDGVRIVAPMSFERLIPTPAAEPAPSPGPAGTAGTEITPAMRLQILSTEHWSLLASRNLAWNESFTRAGIFLTSLSGAIVALALVAQASDFGEGFRLFGLVILPVVLFIGIGTSLRLDSSSYHDVKCIIGMNRIRAAYLELAPDLAPYFVMGTNDDFDGIEATMGVVPGRSMALSVIAATPWLVSVLNAMLAGAIGALLTMQLGADAWAAIVVGAIVFVAALAFVALYERAGIQKLMSAHQPMFPAPRPDSDRAAE